MFRLDMFLDLVGPRMEVKGLVDRIMAQTLCRRRQPLIIWHREGSACDCEVKYVNSADGAWRGRLTGAGTARAFTLEEEGS